MTTSESDDAILSRARRAALLAVERFGREAQLDMLIEEAGETVVEIMHARRSRDSDVDRELADLALVVLGIVSPESLSRATDRLLEMLEDHARFEREGPWK